MKRITIQVHIWRKLNKMNKKILVLATGWHFSSQFYTQMSKQKVPEGWEIDYFCVAHRPPENKYTISEKEHLRQQEGDTPLTKLDMMMYEYPITTEQIESCGWEYILEDNTVGDMEVFNQWSEKYNYRDYDFVLITHDDNLILSDELFTDIVENNIMVYKPILESKSGHRFEVEEVPISDGWSFIDNGYNKDIPKAFEPRGSFSLYKKELIDMLPNNKFDMYQEGGRGIVTRVGETKSIGHEGISAWNAHAGTFREFLYEGGLVDKTRYFSLTKRVSKYCIEGERGFIHNARADGQSYINDVIDKMRELKWL